MLTKQKGKQGEKIAIDYLLKRGHLLLAKNFRSQFGEIDIITTYQGNIYIYEVKLRKTMRYGFGDLAINESKIQKIINTFERWIERNVHYTNYPKYINALIIDPDGGINEFEIR
ncbi:MAG: hypothetical protein KatS3mg084_0089 [Candidatus Dojkabacteria bacterium]|jgi:putative endonuclease|nr:MAG: hypothetical protein KatS3mg084_0089 [Candidatus Dojkabacteria bacterium]